MGISSKLQAIYPSLPLILQNLLISGQGWIFRRRRFSGQFQAELRKANGRATWSEQDLLEWQLTTLRDFLNHAYLTSPYWARRMQEVGVSPKDLRSLACLSKFPVLEKDDLRRFTPEIASTAFDVSSLDQSYTSGTTGTPITVAFTTEDQQQRFAVLYRMFKQFGIEPMARSVRFSGRTLFPRARETGIFWRHNWPMSQMLMSSYDLHPDNLQSYVDRMAKFGPVVIDGYPSSIYIVARFINQTGQSSRICPKVVMTTAETLEDYQRKEIREAFGDCAVINQYASSEGAPFITEDPDGDLVVNTDTGVFEFVRPGTEIPAEPGEIAEMLLTSFTTHAYPLIRYRIGDTVLVPRHPKNSNFWDMPVVDQILGRQEDILFTPERGFIPSLNKVCMKAPSTIVEIQIVQTAPMAMLLKVVPDRSSGYTPEQLDVVKDELRLRVGNVDIEVEEYDSLPRGKNGKLRAVIGMPRAGITNATSVSSSLKVN